MLKFFDGINEKVAVFLTKSFGTMWVCYAFIIYGLLPLYHTFHQYQDSLLYWSNWIQLWSLPLLMVGTNILGRAAETRAKLDHEKLAQTYEEQLVIYKDMLTMMGEEQTQATALADIQSKLVTIETALAQR